MGELSPPGRGSDEGRISSFLWEICLIRILQNLLMSYDFFCVFVYFIDIQDFVLGVRN